jgi:DNA-binding Xre family transcriptional regulator
MSGHTKWADIRGDLAKRPGFEKRAKQLRDETLEEIRLYDLRRSQAISQIDMAGRLAITQAAISKFENADDVRISTLRDYLEAMGARLELVAVFEDDNERRVPINIGKDAA